MSSLEHARGTRRDAAPLCIGDGMIAQLIVHRTSRTAMTIFFEAGKALGLSLASKQYGSLSINDLEEFVMYPGNL